MPEKKSRIETLVEELDKHESELRDEINTHDLESQEDHIETVKSHLLDGQGNVKYEWLDKKEKNEAFGKDLNAKLKKRLLKKHGKALGLSGEGASLEDGKINEYTLNQLYKMYYGMEHDTIEKGVKQAKSNFNREFYTENLVKPNIERIQKERISYIRSKIQPEDIPGLLKHIKADKYFTSIDQTAHHNYIPFVYSLLRMHKEKGETPTQKELHALMDQIEANNGHAPKNLLKKEYASK